MPSSGNEKAASEAHFNFLYDRQWESLRGRASMAPLPKNPHSGMMSDAPGGLSWQFAHAHTNDEIAALNDIDTEREFEVCAYFTLSSSKLKKHKIYLEYEEGDSPLLAFEASGKFGIESDQLKITFYKNEEGRLSAAAAKMTASSALFATNLFLANLNSLLSNISYTHNVPLTYDVVSVKYPGVEEKRVLYTTNYQVQPLHLQQLGISQLLSPAYALYREAISNPSYPYRFFCFAKIMEGAFGSLNGVLHEQARVLNIKLPRRKVIVPSSRFIHSNYRSYIGKSVREFWEREVQSKRKRDLFAHFSLDTRMRQDFDNPSYHHDMANMAFICDLCARELIQELAEAALFISNVSPA